MQGLYLSTIEVLALEVVEVRKAEDAVFLSWIGRGGCLLSCLFFLVDLNDFLFLNDLDLGLEEAIASDGLSMLNDYSLFPSAGLIALLNRFLLNERRCWCDVLGKVFIKRRSVSLDLCNGVLNLLYKLVVLLKLRDRVVVLYRGSSLLLLNNCLLLLLK